MKLTPLSLVVFQVVAAHRFFYNSRVIWRLDVSGKDGIDDRGIELGVVIFDQHLQPLQHRREYAHTPVLAGALMVKIMDDDRPAPAGFPLDALPRYRLGTGEEVALVSTADVIGNRRAVSVNFHPTPDVVAVKYQLRVRQTIRVQYLDGGCISRTPWPLPLWQPVHHGQCIAIDNFVPKTQTHLLAHRHFALGVAIAANIVRPGSVAGLQALAKLIGPHVVEFLDACVGAQGGVIRFEDRPEGSADRVIQDARDSTGCPAIVAHHVTHARDDPVAVHIEVAIGRT